MSTGRLSGVIRALRMRAEMGTLERLKELEAISAATGKIEDWENFRNYLEDSWLKILAVVDWCKEAQAEIDSPSLDKLLAEL